MILLPSLRVVIRICKPRISVISSSINMGSKWQKSQRHLMALSTRAANAFEH